MAILTPLYTASLVAGSCEGLIETANKIQSGELDGLSALGELIGVGLLLKASQDSLAEWEPIPGQEEYQQAIQEYADAATEIIGQWLNQEISSETVPDLIGDNCEAVQEVMEDVIQAMKDSGLSDEGIAGMLEELAQRMEEIVEELDSE